MLRMTECVGGTGDVMNRLGKAVAMTVAGLAAVSIAASPAWAAEDASSVAAKKCAKPVGLASGIAWDHSDPLYMKIVPAVTWQNCRGAIREVTLETRVINPQGGLAATGTVSLTPDLAHKANGQQTYSKPMFLNDNGGWYVPRLSDSSGDFQSCVQRANGKSTTALNGYTFYTVAKAYDRNGQQILQKISPSVVCDQNG